MFDTTPYETTAQIAVGLVGFAALLNYLSQNAASTDAHSAARGDYMLETAVVALVASLLPETLAGVGVEPETVWRIGSSLLATYFALLAARTVLLVKKTGWGSTVYHLVPSLVAVVASIVHQFFSAIGEPIPSYSGAYYLGVVILLISSATTFLAQYKLENRGAWRGRK